MSIGVYSQLYLHPAPIEGLSLAYSQVKAKRHFNKSVTLRKAASTQNLVNLTKIRCNCKTKCSSNRCDVLVTKSQLVVVLIVISVTENAII